VYEARMWSFEWNMLYVYIEYSYGKIISLI